MRKIITGIFAVIAFLGFGVTLVGAVSGTPVTVPAAPGSNYFLTSTSTGAYIATSSILDNGTLRVKGTTTLATTTTSVLNGVIVVDGVRFPQTGAGIISASIFCHQLSSLCNTIYVPVGIYSTATSVPLFSNQTLKCAAGATIIGTGGVPTVLTYTTGDRNYDDYQNIGIDGCIIKAQASGVLTQSHLLRLWNTDGIKILNSHFEHIGTISGTPESLWIQWARNVLVDNNYLYNLTGDGIQINATDYFVVSNNIVSSSTDDGIDIDTDFAVANNTFPSRYGTVVGNTVQHIPNGNGIRIEDSHFITVVGNTVKDSGASCILNNNSDELYASSTNVTISANNVSECVFAGITNTGTWNNGALGNLGTNIIGNTICHSGLIQTGAIRAGINIAASSTLVEGNYICDSGIAGGDGGAIVVFKADNVTIGINHIASSTNGINLWNGDGLQTYNNVSINATQGFENVTNEYVNVSGGSVKNLSVDSGISTIDIRPLVASTTIDGEVRGLGLSPLSDSGLLRLSAGGGTADNEKTFIDLSGYSTIGDMDGTIIFGTNSTERARLLKIGSFGLGTSSPWGRFSISGKANQSYPIFVVSTSTSNSTGTPFYIGSTGDQYLGLNGSKIGIQTTNPSSPLTIANIAVPVSQEGDILITGASSPTFAIRNTGGLNKTYRIQNAADSFIFSDNTTEVMRMKPSGLQITGYSTTTQNAYIANKVGIATSTGNAPLTIVGDAVTSGEVGVLQIHDSVTYNKKLNLGYDDAGDYAWIQAVQTGNAAKTLFLSVGKLGVGTNTPSRFFSVQGDSYFSGDIKNVANITATGTASTTNLIVSLNATATNATTTTLYVSGSATTTLAGPLNATYFRLIGATSTALNGFSIDTGCYAVTNTCLTLGNLSGIVPVTNGGTGASTAATARTALGAAASGANTDITSIVSAFTSIQNGNNTYTLAGAPRHAWSVSTGSLGANIGYGFAGTFSASGGLQGVFTINPILTQSSIGGYTALTINPTETSLGAGPNILQDWQTNSVSRVVVDNKGRMGFGTSTPAWILQIATSSAGALFKGQLAITDTNSAVNLKHWIIANEGGFLYIGTSTDLLATSSIAALTLANGGALGIASTTPGGLVGISVLVTPPGRNAFLISSSSASGNTTLFRVENTGHFISSSTNPVLSSCGTTPSMVGDDTHGEITVGSIAATGCTVTFGQPWAAAPVCVVSNQTMSITAALTYTISSTAIVFSQATGLVGDKLDYICQGVQ